MMLLEPLRLRASNKTVLNGLGCERPLSRSLGKVAFLNGGLYTTVREQTWSNFEKIKNDVDLMKLMKL